MPYATAMDHEWDDLLGAGGPTPGQEHVFECLLSDLQWSAVQAKLNEKKVPYKVQLPGSVEREPYNNPTW